VIDEGDLGDEEDPREGRVELDTEFAAFGRREILRLAGRRRLSDCGDLERLKLVQMVLDQRRLLPRDPIDDRLNIARRYHLARGEMPKVSRPRHNVQVEMIGGPPGPEVMVDHGREKRLGNKALDNVSELGLCVVRELVQVVREARGRIALSSNHEM
jgi:hypothetical protein